MKSVLTSELIERVEKAEHNYNPKNYLKHIDFYEKHNGIVIAELGELEEFKSSDMYKKANATVQSLVDNQVRLLEDMLKKNGIEIKQLLAWINGYI